MNKHKHNSKRVSYQLEEAKTTKAKEKKNETVSRKRERKKKNDELCVRAKKKKRRRRVNNMSCLTSSRSMNGKECEKKKPLVFCVRVVGALT